MKKTTFFLLLFCAISWLMSCGNGSQRDSSSSHNNNTIVFSSMKQSDTTAFKRKNGEVCQVLVDASITYPKLFGNENSTEKLQKLFITTVLEGSDSLDITQAVARYVMDKLGKNATDDGYTSEENETDIPISNKIVVNVNITVAYHENDILTICKEETYKKDAVPAKTHKYYNIDLKTMTLIDLNMFAEGTLGAVCEALKNRLMEQNNAQNADELSDLGYFNIDNLSVTANFCFGEKGVTFSYAPQELAADACLEPKITIDYETLNTWARENSVLKRF